MLATKFWFIWLSSFKGEDFLKINQSETRKKDIPAQMGSSEFLNKTKFM
jgi:hypothetical protein